MLMILVTCDIGPNQRARLLNALEAMFSVQLLILVIIIIICLMTLGQL